MIYLKYSKQKIAKFLYSMCFFILAISCNKNDDSPNTINYSLDGGPVRSCSGKILVNEFMGGPSCSLAVERLGHHLFGESADITIFSDSDCNLTGGSLPYSTSHFSLGINDNNDVTMSPQVSPYVYPDTNPVDSANGQISHLILEITYRKDGRIKGNIAGEIFGGDYHAPKLKMLTCDFDLLVPFR